MGEPVCQLGRGVIRVEGDALRYDGVAGGPNGWLVPIAAISVIGSEGGVGPDRELVTVVIDGGDTYRAPREAEGLDECLAALSRLLDGPVTPLPLDDMRSRCWWPPARRGAQIPVNSKPIGCGDG